MSALSLTKNYADGTLLFVSDIHGMWTELETKTNGNIDSDNVQDGWARLDSITLSKNTDYDIGLSASALIRYYTTDDTFAFLHETTARDHIFKVEGTEVARISSTSNFTSTKDVYFYNKSTTYPLSYLIGYAKPTLIYSDSTTIYVEQNTTTANQTLIVFPVGPIAVTEDTALTHKFRMLKTSATANGYISTHTGAADSGKKVGLTMTANTWYFVYAVVVQYGDDAGNNFILVVDSTNPDPSNWSTLDSTYGSGKWVYIGLFRNGMGDSLTTTLVPFIQDSQGWHMFTGSVGSDYAFGILITDRELVSSTSYTTYHTTSISNSGEAVPSSCSMLKLHTAHSSASGTAQGAFLVSDSADVVLWTLPSFDDPIASDVYYGWEIKIPNVTGIKFKAKCGAATDDDYSVTVTITGVLDEWA